MDIVFNYDYRGKEMQEFPLEELARYVLVDEDMPQESCCCVTFVDNDEMTSLNEHYRGKTGPTDVLSFEAEGVGGDFDFDWPDDPEDVEELELGDIIIAPDVAEEQCSDFNMTFEGEISLLLVHGLLHLCGYDHIEDEDARVMQAREVDLLSAWAAAHPNVAPPDYELNLETVVGEH